MNQGISLPHGTHQVAQKFNRTTLPLYSDSRSVAPVASVNAKSGAGCKEAGITDGFRNKLSQASTQRLANTRGPGNASTPVHTIATANTASAHLRTGMRARCRLHRASACAVSGSQFESLRSRVMRSSTHSVVFGSLLLSISSNELLSKRLLCAAEQCAHRCRIQSERRRHFFVAEPLPPKQQQLRRAWLDGSQHPADAVLLLRGRAQVLWSGNRLQKPEEPLIPPPPFPASKFIERPVNRRAIQPAIRPFGLRLRAAP